MMKHRKHKLRLNGREVSAREFFRSRCGGTGVPFITKTFSESTPHSSLSISCHRDTVEAYREVARRHNLTGVSFDNEGNYTATSKRDHAEMLKALQMHNEDAGYGGW